MLDGQGNEQDSLGRRRELEFCQEKGQPGEHVATWNTSGSAVGGKRMFARGDSIMQS